MVQGRAHQSGTRMPPPARTAGLYRGTPKQTYPCEPLVIFPLSQKNVADCVRSFWQFAIYTSVRLLGYQILAQMFRALYPNILI